MGTILLIILILLLIGALPRLDGLTAPAGAIIQSADSACF
jgi:Protein of unknown function (DUF3309)